MTKITVTKKFGPGSRSNPKYFGRVKVEFAHGEYVDPRGGTWTRPHLSAQAAAAKFHTDLNAKGILATMKGLYTVEFWGADFNLQHGYGAFPKVKKIKGGERFFPGTRSTYDYPKFKVGAKKRGLFPIEALKEEWERIEKASVVWNGPKGRPPQWRRPKGLDPWRP